MWGDGTHAIFSSCLNPTKLFERWAEITDITAKLNIILHENQRKIHSSPARFKVIKAGKRFGKSKLAVYTIVKWAGMKPNGVFWYIAPTYGQAKSIAWHDLLFILPASQILRRMESALAVQLMNGAWIYLKGADNEDSLRGTALDGVVFDEAAYIDQYIWPAIIRGQLAKSMGPAIFISSPNKRGTNWYSAFFDEAKRRNANGNAEWDAFYFTIYDNPVLNKAEIDSIKSENTDDTWNLEYLAIESEFAGQRFAEFDYDRNVAALPEGQLIPLYYRGHDWGTDHPTVCLWAAIRDKQLPIYITDEYVKSGLIIADNCETIKNKTGGKTIEWDVIDPSANKVDPISKRKLIHEYQRCGIPCMAGDRGDRGYDIVKMFLKRGYLKIDPKCKTLIYELKNLQWGDKVGDDATDALRYLLVRVHDFIFNGQTFKEEKVEPVNKRILNLHDLEAMQPSKGSVSKDWILEEVA